MTRDNAMSAIERLRSIRMSATERREAEAALMRAEAIVDFFYVIRSLLRRAIASVDHILHNIGQGLSKQWKEF
jgi:hypothetical protein